MSEFKIKATVDINDKEAKEKLKTLSEIGSKEPINIKINTKEIVSDLDKVEQLFKNAFKLDNTSLKNLENVQSALKEISKLSRSTQEGLFGGSRGGSQNSEQQDLLRQYKDIEKTISKLQTQMNRGLGDESIRRTTSEIERLNQELSSVYSRLNSSSKQQLNIIDTQRANSELVEYNRNLSKIEDTATSAMTRLNGINFNNIDDSGRIDTLRNELQQLISMCERPVDLNFDTGQALNRIENINQEIRNLERVENLRGYFEQLEGSIRSAFGDQYVSEFRSELQSLESSARNLDGSFDSAFNGLNTRLRDARSELRQLGNSTREVSGFWRDFTGSLTAFSLGNILGDGLSTAIRGIKNVFLEIDEGMANIKKVSNIVDIDSINELEGIRNSAIDIAKDVGMASSEVMNAISSSLQAGIGGMKESITAARQSAILANVGDMNIDAAASAINTVINGFRIDPLKEMQMEVGNTVKKTTELTAAMDMLNYAGNNYAVGTDGVAEALKRGGTVLHEYGVSLGDTIGLITAANEAVQNPEKVGNGLKSIAINLAGMKVSADDGSLALNKTVIKKFIFL